MEVGTWPRWRARISDLLTSSSRRSWTRSRRPFILASLIFVFLVLLLVLSIHRGFSTAVRAEAYHPSQGRYLHGNGNRQGAHIFNKVRSHDELLRRFNREKSAALRERKEGGESTVIGNASTLPCNCTDHDKKHHKPLSRLYPLTSFQEGSLTFAIVILAYNRSDLLLRLLNHYSAMPHLETIVVVWNSQEATPPREEWEHLGPHPVQVEFKVQLENRLRNRLQLFYEIKSSG